MIGTSWIDPRKNTLFMCTFDDVIFNNFNAFAFFKRKKKLEEDQGKKLQK